MTETLSMTEPAAAGAGTGYLPIAEHGGFKRSERIVSEQILFPNDEIERLWPLLFQNGLEV